MDGMTRISEEQGMWMFHEVRRLAPERTLEIGLAYGFSTVFVLAALDEVGKGHHTAIDPFQSHYGGVGARQAEQLGLESRFQLIPELSVQALARLATEKQEFQFLYIDGNHRFDDVLVDFTLAAGVCAPGGVIVLDDMWMPAVRTAATWVATNRSDFRQVTTPVNNIAQFERVGSDSRDWNHYVPFSIARDPSFLRRAAGRIKRAVLR
jgi:predicted O-methyltransferase YrrM